MADTIVQLCAADFEEATAHLSLVFEQPDFASLLPALYKPTDQHMSRNYALRRDGRIAAIVGLFPITWIVGDQRLSLAGIGGVSVNPAYRGQGLMRRLMDAAVADIDRDQYDAACLGGSRRRYAHWGFEKAGVEASFVVTPNSLAHTLSEQAGDSFTLGPAGPADFPALQALYVRMPIRCERGEDSFGDHLRNWRREPRIVRAADGRVGAYGCVDGKDLSCVECCAADPASLDAFLYHLVSRDGKPFRITLPLLQDATFRRLMDVSDDVSLIEAGNWRIRNWPRVIGALLRAKHSVTPLVPGECVLGIKGGASIRMRVDHTASCEWTDDAPDVEAEPGELIRMLAAPIPVNVPARAAALQQWRPLPLMLPLQDRI